MLHPGSKTSTLYILGGFIQRAKLHTAFLFIYFTAAQPFLFKGGPLAWLNSSASTLKHWNIYFNSFTKLSLAKDGIHLLLQEFFLADTKFPVAFSIDSNPGENVSLKKKHLCGGTLGPLLGPPSPGTCGSVLNITLC